MYQTALDDEDRDEEFNKSIMGKTRMTPVDKLRQIEEVKNLLYKRGNNKKMIKLKDGSQVEGKWPDDVRQDWGLEFGDFKEFEARVIPHPTLNFRNIRGCEIQKNRIRMEHAIRSIPLTSWAIFASQRNEQDAQKLGEKLHFVSNRLGVGVRRPDIFTAKFNDEDDLVSEIMIRDIKSI